MQAQVEKSERTSLHQNIVLGSWNQNWNCNPKLKIRENPFCIKTSFLEVGTKIGIEIYFLSRNRNQNPLVGSELELVPITEPGFENDSGDKKNRFRPELDLLASLTIV